MILVISKNDSIILILNKYIDEVKYDRAKNAKSINILLSLQDITPDEYKSIKERACFIKVIDYIYLLPI